ncbi:MAG: 3-methyl-2-oxobutanoate hydroxymethyltransferase [Lentisphaeria bacterium]|nr:3-methyl-2-oxobutanoate hydroxymethyltransferase [Lentisphaeria bacterium]
MSGRANIRKIQNKYQNNEKIVVLTAYDAHMAALCESLPIDILLVGDSLGMTVLGYDNTIPVTMDHMVHHCQAVTRGNKSTFIIGDLPYLSCEISPELAIQNGGRLMQEGGVSAVKVEGGQHVAPTIQAMVRAGVPVVGHIGLMPQRVATEGGYRIHGKTPEEREALIADAKAVAAAGACAIVLEGIPSDISKAITEVIDIPTIGIGAGPYCSGQVQVYHDLLGLFERFVPKHTRQYAQLNAIIKNALSAYAKDVQNGTFPSDNESF